MRNLILFVLALLLCASAAQARGSRVVVVIAGSSSIRDFADPSLRELYALFSKSSAALLNVRTGRPSHDSEPGTKSGFESGCLSLGAGAMATGGAEVARARNATSAINGLNVGDLFNSRTTMNHKPAQVLHLETAKLQRINEAASYRAKPGALGSALRKAGIRTAIVGNSDLPGEIHREAVTAAMDENGIVDSGNVDDEIAMRFDPASPYSHKIDCAALLVFADDALQKARFIVIDFGDTFRADAYAESCTNAQAAALKRAADARLSRFVGMLARELDPKTDLLMLVSPNARLVSEIEGEKMGAILISGPGFRQGMLISPSTRKPGVVTLCDVAPTVLAFFGIKPGIDMVGRPMRQSGTGNASAALLEMNAQASAQAERQPAMRGVSVAQSVIVCLVVAAILLTSSVPVKRLAAWLVPPIAALPLVMLYLPLIHSGGLVGTVVLLVVVTLALLGLCVLVFRSPSRAFVWLCGAVVLSLMVDLVRGAPLMAASIASYSIVEGARYYGIGNELMGTMLGAAVIGVGMALAPGRLGKRAAGLLAVAVFGLVFVFVSAPELGAKVGGAMAMAPAMAVALLARRGWRPSFVSISVVVLVTVLLVGGMFAFDALRGGAEQSHAGRTVGMVAGGGAAGILDIFQRKLALNFMLVATSVWSRLLGITLAAAALLLWWGKRRLGEEFLNREESAAAIGCCVGVIAAFIFNDSGVVAGATCSVFLWALLALKLLDQTKQCPGE